MNRFISLFVLALVSFSVPLTAEQAEFSPLHDAMIKQSDPGDNYGSEVVATVGFYNGFINSLVYFNLSSIMGAIVEDATLEIYPDYSYGTIPDNNWLYLVDNSWDESTITWDTDPGYNVDISLFFDAPMMDVWLSLDVTSFVSAWVEGTYSNYGFYIQQLDATYGSYSFYTSEYTHSDFHPRLTVNYHQVVVQPTSLGSIKSLFK